MALKSSQNKFTSSSKHDDDDPNHQKNQGGVPSYNNSQGFKRGPKSVRKKKSKKSGNNSSLDDNSRSLSHKRTLSSLPLIPEAQPTVLPVPAMNEYYGGQNPIRYPVGIYNWNTATRMRFQNPLYRIPFQPVAVPIINPRMLPPRYPYPPGYMYPPPGLAPVLPSSVIIDEFPALPNCYQNVSSPEQTVPNEINEPSCSEFENFDDPPFYEVTHNPSQPTMDPMDIYLSLPRELFPKAMMLSMDPNPIIDRFCEYNDVLDHASWIMDLEFGVPREATTRPIASYDVKYNSVYCKNAPNAIHPGFERCSPEFKSMLTYYYECVVSTWYTGYTIWNQDRSVENFQSWLFSPMREFGMCWP